MPVASIDVRFRGKADMSCPLLLRCTALTCYSRIILGFGVSAMKPVAASGGSIFANFDVLDDGEDAAGRTGARLLNLAIVALGLGVICALAFAWSNADGRLRFELQSAATAPRAAAPQEIERLRGELDALKNDVKELTETQRQA